MEKIEKVNPELYKREFALLDGITGKFDYSIFNSPVLSENNFFCVIAWYIEILKKASIDDWDKTINQFVDDALQIDDIYDRFLFISKHILTVEIDWYSTNGYSFNADLCKSILERSDSLYQRAKEKDKCNGDKPIKCLPGISSNLVPKWFWTWFDGNELEKKVMEANRRNFVNNIRQVMKKNEENEK